MLLKDWVQLLHSQIELSQYEDAESTLNRLLQREPKIDESELRNKFSKAIQSLYKLLIAREKLKVSKLILKGSKLIAQGSKLAVHKRKEKVSGKYKEAMKFLKKALDIEPDNISAMNSYASCLTRIGQYERH